MEYYDHQSQFFNSDSDVSGFFKKFNSKQSCPIPICPNKSVGSHSVSRLWLYNNSENNKVIHIPIYDLSGLNNNKDLEKISSIDDAGVFYGFCLEHEKWFHPFEQKLENVAFFKQNKKYIILLGLRALARKLYEYNWKMEMDYIKDNQQYISLYKDHIDLLKSAIKYYWYAYIESDYDSKNDIYYIYYPIMNNILTSNYNLAETLYNKNIKKIPITVCSIPFEDRSAGMFISTIKYYEEELKNLKFIKNNNYFDYSFDTNTFYNPKWWRDNEGLRKNFRLKTISDMGVITIDPITHKAIDTSFGSIYK